MKYSILPLAGSPAAAASLCPAAGTACRSGARVAGAVASLWVVPDAGWPSSMPAALGSNSIGPRNAGCWGVEAEASETDSGAPAAIAGAGREMSERAGGKFGAGAGLSSAACAALAPEGARSGALSWPCICRYVLATGDSPRHHFSASSLICCNRAAIASVRKRVFSLRKPSQSKPTGSV